MFPVYFPTTKKAEAPEIFKMDPYADTNIHFEAKWRKGKDFNSEEEQAEHIKLLAKGQILDDEDIPCLLLAGYFVPLESGLICLHQRNGGSGGEFTMAYDAKTRTCSPGTQLLRPKSVDGLHCHNEPKMLSDTLANLIGRATGLSTNKLISTPNAVYFKFKNHFKAMEAPDYRSNQRDQVDGPKVAENIDRGVALTKERLWVEYSGKTAIDVNTGDVITTDFDLEEVILYIPDTTNNVFFSNDKSFSFNRREIHRTFSRSSFHFNLDSFIDDKDIGSKLLKSMGIEYDYYDNLTFTEDGYIDPISFASGKSNFGVMKTNAWVFDADALKEFVKNNPLEDEPDNGKVGFFRARKSDTSRNNDFNKATSRILSLNIGKDGLSDKSLDIITNQWNTGSALRWLDNREGDDYNSFGYANEDERQFANAKKREIIRKYIKQIEVEVPIFTPRFSEEVNAQLNEVIKDIKGYYMEFASLCEYTNQCEDVPFF